MFYETINNNKPIVKNEIYKKIIRSKIEQNISKTNLRQKCLNSSKQAKVLLV